MGKAMVAAAAALAMGASALTGWARAQDIPSGPELPEFDEPPSILAILAHPDDEITIAPALAIAARSGGEVALVFATSGDAGPGSSGLEPGEALAALREDEARCSASALGLEQPQFWRLGDGTLAPLARMPDSPARTLAARVAEAVERYEPDVVMTWGPEGGYGHSDHRMVSAVVTQVLAGMGDGRPDLLYSAIPADPAIAAPPGFEDWARTDPALITDRIGYERVDLEAAGEALGCYESQFPQEARAALIPMLHGMVWRGKVHFRLAFAHEF
ncbi:PIG-L family deacetylase [Erythrobacter sp.]|uniref:PIG-L family deacetylase n=1 Tax=Erythrobacter sp. TaxID=1042 RepID=UPI001425E682|nr:PIG-L family deacetylase [Erythrobacter sp.]QIQ87264.1 MAG: PIG-L family deacetylase [Erythrobacter sp.]